MNVNAPSAEDSAAEVLGPVPLPQGTTQIKKIAGPYWAWPGAIPLIQHAIQKPCQKPPISIIRSSGSGGLFELFVQEHA